MKNNKSVALRIKSALVFVCLMVVQTLVAAFMVFPDLDNNLPTFTWLNGHNVAGMSVEGAINQLTETIPEEIMVHYTDDRGHVLEENSLSTVLIELQYPVSVIRRDLRAAAETNWQDKWLHAIKNTREERYFEYAAQYREELLLTWAETQKKRLDQEALDAAVWVEGGVVKSQPEQVGRSLAVSELMEVMAEELVKKPQEVISFALEINQPEATLETLGDFSRELVRFSTHLQDDNDRNINVQIAAERINSARILPDEIFSFNNRVGDVVPEEGFQPAPVIANGRVVMGVGGGICQVSSTLYQSALRGGLNIVERWHHSVPIGYLPLGMDAAVASGTKDLVIQNPYQTPLMIGAWIEGNQHITAIFGAKDVQVPKVNVEIRKQRKLIPTTTLVEDDQLDKGVKVVVQPGENGHWLQVYRTMEQEDGRQREELISEDYYPPVDEIIHIGTGETAFNKK